MPEITAPPARLCSRCREPLPADRRTRMHSPCARLYRAELAARQGGAPAPVRAARRGRSTVSGRRFGVEIECYLPGGNVDGLIGGLRAAGLSVHDYRATHCGSSTNAWTLKRDGSLSRNGIELVSPPLSGAEGYAALKTACRVLRQQRAYVNRTCGLHVHHEVADLNLYEFKNIVIGYANHQAAIDALVAESRRYGAGYCGPMDTHVLNGVRSCASLGAIAGLSRDRYTNVNIQAFAKYGTVELRQHHGSINFAKIAAWVAFGQAFIDRCKADGADGTVYEIAPANVSTADLLAQLAMPGVRRRQLLERITTPETVAA
jgi:hypothetical protein